MSLTRDQWEEMWNHILNIEYSCVNINLLTRSKKLKAHNAYSLTEVNKIKKLIQSVIGQME